MSNLGKKKSNCPWRPDLILVWGVAILCVAGCAGSGVRLDPDNQNPLSEKQIRAGLRALLTAKDFIEFEALPDSQQVQWLRMFWRDHDPTPTTTENEFRSEHDRRMRYALFYFASIVGPIPWDDRGEVYLRYGEPDERRFLATDPSDDRRGSGSPPRTSSLTERGERNRQPLSSADLSGVRFALGDAGGAGGEIWSYYRWGLDFHFRDGRGLGVYTLVPLIDGVGPDQNYSEFIAQKITAIDLQPAMFFHDYGVEHLDYALDVVRFRAEGNTFNVDVNLGYPLAELARGGVDSSKIAIRRAMIIRDDSLRDVASELSVISRRVGPIQGQQLLVEQKVFNLPPGGYTLSVAIEDLYSGKKGIYKKNFRLPEFISREVQEISDIELASFVWSVYEPGSPYVKANHLVMPLPSRVYLQDQPISFYFEIYNLAQDKNDLTKYRIEYEILDVEAKHSFHKQEEGKLSSKTRDVHRASSLADTHLEPGEYLLSVRVKDEITGKQKRTLTRFKIVPGE